MTDADDLVRLQEVTKPKTNSTLPETETQGEVLLGADPEAE